MITVGVIGAGYWGKNLVRTFNAMKTADLKYISDSSPKTLNSFSSYKNVKKTDDYNTVINDSEVDAVVIATPPITHHEIAKKALLSGKHVLVEKPMTLETKHAEELVKIAEERDLTLMVGHLMLYHPCINAIKELIESGDMGKVYYLYNQRLNLGKVRSDENALLSFAPHDISIALYLIGDTPVSVSANGQCYLQKDVEDVAFLTMYFPDGKMANIHVSWLDPHKIRRTTVVGSSKMVVFDDMEPREKVKIYDKGVEMSAEGSSYSEFLSLRDGNISSPAIKMSEPLMLECSHFVDCIVNKRQPRSDGHNGLVVTRVLEAGQKSLKNGGTPVEIDI